MTPLCQVWVLLRTDIQSSHTKLLLFFECGSVVPDDGPRGNILSVTVADDESQ